MHSMHALISIKNLKRWLKRHESKGMGFVRDEDRSGRPSGVSIARQEHLKNKLQESNQRVWVARYVPDTIWCSVFSWLSAPTAEKTGFEFLKGGYHADKTGERKAPCVDSLGAALIATLIHIPVNLILLD
ncbi:MAG: hypothetical protein WAW61_14730 [Methylococcaceae bacterium]